MRGFMVVSEAIYPSRFLFTINMRMRKINKERLPSHAGVGKDFTDSKLGYFLSSYLANTTVLFRICGFCAWSDLMFAILLFVRAVLFVEFPRSRRGARALGAIISYALSFAA
jgi:hypothetical protein